MKNIITGIFNENEFKEYQVQASDFKLNNIEFWVPSENNHFLEAFFIVIYIDSLQLTDVENIKEICLNYYSIIERTEILKSAMEKNTYAIVCLKIDKTPVEQGMKQKIFDIEEDPQKFKKHVLVYTENQSESFKNKSKEYTSTMETLNNVLNSDKFQEFKNNPDKDTLYNLVTGLFIKLPFLRYQGQEKKIDDISGIIVEKIGALGEKKLVLVNKVIEMEMEDIKNLNIDDFIKLLKGVESDV